MKQLQTLTASSKPPPMPHLRGALQYVEVVHVLVVLACGIFILATCEPCSMNGLQNEVDYVACGSIEENSKIDVPNGFSSDVGSAYPLEYAASEQNLEDICQHSNLFCFRSTLPGFSSSFFKSPGVEPDVEIPEGSSKSGVNDSWSSDSGSFGSYGERSERTISCSLSYQDLFLSQHTGFNKKEDASSCMGPLHDVKSNHAGPVKSSSSCRHVEISPPLLDWGEQYLYFPSSASVTVKNACTDRILILYEPHSTSPNFYPCNSSEIFLQPGEVALVCFMFLPTLLGLSSAQIVLQTSAGGFLVHAKGLAVESPYGIRPLLGLDILNGKWRENVSLFNPLNESISVEELTAWIVVSSGNTTSLTKAVCSVNSTESLSDFRLISVKKWLNVRNSDVDLPNVAMRPFQNWEIAPGRTEAIMEVDISYSSEGKISGVVWMQLFSSSEKKMDKVMVPLEAEFTLNSAPNETISPIIVSAELLLPCGSSGTVVATLSVRVDAPYLLHIVKVIVVGGGRQKFNIKYIEGLLLFPGTTIQVAVVTYTMVVVQDDDPLDETPEIDENCKLLIQTNDSSTSESGIRCKDIPKLCLRHNLDSSLRFQQLEGLDHDNTRSKLLDSTIGSPSPTKVLDSVEADELILRNWMSQATISGLSILDAREVTFGTIQVGSHSSQWIAVKNPSQQPVVMQLIMNSAEIVDDCRELDRLLLPTAISRLVSNTSFAPTRYGFSIAENAVTEAFVHPYGRAFLGPIIFQPSNRCSWKSSALIRNNLSGVEWLYLQGLGGSLSLILLEDSEPVQSLDFKLNLPARLNLSSPDICWAADRNCACSQPSLKELYAKNTGDLPLEVKKIKVSGTCCGLDGFMVHACKGFSLKPGDLAKVTVSYQTDFSAATLHRDLELSLTTGILVIPMKASVSMQMFNFCQKSIFWMRVKKSIIAVFLAGLVLFVLVCCILPNLVTLGSQGCLPKNGKGFSHGGKSSPEQRITKKITKFPLTSQLNGSLKSTNPEEVLPLKSVSRIPDGQVTQKRDPRFSQITSYHKEISSLVNLEKEAISPCPVSALPVDISKMQEVPQVGNLTIKIGNEKRRRRRKKRNSAAGLPAAFDVSSSHSGNSTPSSPLSPSLTLTPRPWQVSPNGNQSCQSRNLFGQDENRTDLKSVPKVNVLEPDMSTKYGGCNWFSHAEEKPTAGRKFPGKPALFPSATFPSACRPAPDFMTHSPSLVTTSKVAPYERAPGPKLLNKKYTKSEDRMGLEEKFRYDIWGDHIFGQPLTGQSNDVSKKQSSANDNNNSNSFFVRGPQTLMTNSQQMPVSSAYPVD